MDKIYKELKEIKQKYTKDDIRRENLLSTSISHCTSQLIQIVLFNHLYNNSARLIKVSTFYVSIISAKPSEGTHE